MLSTFRLLGAIDQLIDGAETLNYTSGTLFAAQKTSVNCEADSQWIGLADHGDSFSSDVSGGQQSLANIKLSNAPICQDKECK